MQLVLLLLGMACISLPTTAQVPYDLSQAVEYRTVWEMNYQEPVSDVCFTKNFAGIQGFDIVTTGNRYQGWTWATRPRIDTNNLFDWPASEIYPLDYDGIAPLEYVNWIGMVFRSNEGLNPFPMTCIDTINIIRSWNDIGYCTGEPYMSGDVDGDGYLDVVTSGDGHAGRVIRGGPMAGRGCERVFTIHGYQPRGQSNSVMAFYQSSGGIWMLLQYEESASGPHNNTGSLRLYRIGVVRESDTLRATYTFTGELTNAGGNFFNLDVVVDTATGKDWLIVDRYSSSLGRFTERLDVTDGTFKETGDKISGITYIYSVNLGMTLDSSRAVLSLPGTSVGKLLLYADDLQHPFGVARHQGGYNSWAVINDQTGDGKPDILMSNWPSPNGAIRLVSSDSSVASVADSPGPGGLQAHLEGEELVVACTSGCPLPPCLPTIEIVSVSGRVVGSLTGEASPASVSRYNLSHLLTPLSSGAYFVRVQACGGVITVPVMR